MTLRPNCHCHGKPMTYRNDRAAPRCSVMRRAVQTNYNYSTRGIITEQRRNIQRRKDTLMDMWMNEEEDV